MKDWKYSLSLTLVGSVVFCFMMLSCNSSGGDAGFGPDKACVDNDHDGYGNPGTSSCAHAARDCNDSNAAIFPGAIEGPLGDSSCSDGTDNDCDDNIDNNDEGCQIDAVSISGQVTFDFIPISLSSGLNYAGKSPKPVKEAVLEAINAADSSVLTTTATDAAGAYAVTVPPCLQTIIRVKAQILQNGSPSCDFQVVDNTSDKALYVMDSAPFNSGITDISEKNLNASINWSGTGYLTRTAAPFAILDTVYQAYSLVVSSDPDVIMPQLLINWSLNNVAAEGRRDLGQIITSHYDPVENQIYILGHEDNDTDEFDAHVVAHEWGHYLENSFSRSDSIGGRHGAGDKLDPRVAFGEGFGNAFSGMVTGDSYYVDTIGPSQGQNAGVMDLEDNSFYDTDDGWFSEFSIQVILYDLYDSTNDAVDTISMGFTPLYDILTGRQKTADSFTTIFSFLAFLKADNAGDDTTIDAINDLADDEDITTRAVDEWDSTKTESNNGGNPKALPVYTLLTEGGEAVSICGSGENGNYNKLMNIRFIYFEITSADMYTITARPDISGDPVIELFSQGTFIARTDAGDEGYTEELERILSPGLYSGEIYDYNHVSGDYTNEECFAVSLD